MRCDVPDHFQMPRQLEEQKEEVKRLKEKYESTGIKCHGGHENNLPLALWDCPMCTAELRNEIGELKEIKYLTAALLDSFRHEPITTPWAACVPRELLEKLKKLTSPRGEKG